MCTRHMQKLVPMLHRLCLVKKNVTSRALCIFPICAGLATGTSALHRLAFRGQSYCTGLLIARQMLLPTATRRLEANAKADCVRHTQALVLISQPPCAAVIALFRGECLLAHRPFLANEQLSLNDAPLGWGASECCKDSRWSPACLNLTKLQRAMGTVAAKRPISQRRIAVVIPSNAASLMASAFLCTTKPLLASVGFSPPLCGTSPSVIISPSAALSLILVDTQCFL